MASHLNASTEQLVPYQLAWKRLNMFGLRRIFYLVGPEETRFASVDEVPNWFDEV